MAFIEELQRRLTPLNGKAAKLPSSRSSPNLAHDNNGGEGGHPHAHTDDMRGEHKSPFELRALEVALDVVSPPASASSTLVSSSSSILNVVRLHRHSSSGMWVGLKLS